MLFQRRCGDYKAVFFRHLLRQDPVFAKHRSVNMSVSTGDKAEVKFRLPLPAKRPRGDDQHLQRRILGDQRLDYESRFNSFSEANFVCQNETWCAVPEDSACSIQLMSEWVDPRSDEGWDAFGVFKPLRRDLTQSPAVKEWSGPSPSMRFEQPYWIARAQTIL